MQTVVRYSSGFVLLFYSYVGGSSECFLGGDTGRHDMCSTGHYHLTGRTTLLGREIPKVADNMYAKDVRQPRGNYRTCSLQHTRDFVSGGYEINSSCSWVVEH